MEENNNNTELSGTLGSLTQNAINLMDRETQLIDKAQDENGEIEMLDFAPEQNINADSSNPSAIAGSEGLGEAEAAPTIEPVTNNELNNSFSDDINNELNVGEIGSVPPIDNKDKPKKKHVGLFIALIIVVILAVGAGLFYYLNKGNNFFSNRIKLTNPTLELGSELPSDLSYYISIKNAKKLDCNLDTSEVKIDTLGKYNYTLTCGSKKYTGEITVDDTKDPVVKTKTLAKKVGESAKAEEFIYSCDDSTNCKYVIENEEQVNKYLQTIGSYDVNLIITDEKEHTAKATAKLVVLENDVKVYLNCYAQDQTVEDVSGVLSEYDKIAISSSSNYSGIFFRVKEYTISKKDVYDNLKDKYEKEKTISIGGGLEPIFDDSNLIIRFEEALSDSSEFGNIYGNIRSYYEGTKGYKCSITNAN